MEREHIVIRRRWEVLLVGKWLLPPPLTKTRHSIPRKGKLKTGNNKLKINRI
jgi:hypothetical protein